MGLVYGFIPEEWIPTIINILYVIIALVIVLIVDRIILAKLKGIAKRLGLPIEVIKSLLLFFRFILLIIVLLVVASLRVIPSTYFIGTSALIGTAIGFGATRAISNFLSGAYLIASGLFRIGDYIRIGSDEGIVIDMTINYTKIMKDDGTVLVMSNSDLLNKKVQNFKIVRGEEVHYVYPVEVTFDIKTPMEKIKEISEKIKDEIKEDVNSVKFKFSKISRLELLYQVIIEVSEAEKIPKVKEKIFDIVANNLQTAS